MHRLAISHTAGQWPRPSVYGVSETQVHKQRVPCCKGAEGTEIHYFGHNVFFGWPNLREGGG